MSAFIQPQPPIATEEVTPEMFVDTFARFGSEGRFAIMMSDGEYIIGSGDLRDFGAREGAVELRTRSFAAFKAALVARNDEATVTFYRGFFYNQRIPARFIPTRYHPTPIPNALECVGAEILGITPIEFMEMDAEPRQPFIGNHYDHIMALARKVAAAEIQLRQDIIASIPEVRA